jgi:fused signal recognition particle receptor
MEELKKVKRVIGKVIPDAPHETLLVLDATIGQNSIAQAKQFHEALDIDGLVMTKLDSTSKGGVLLNISQEMNLPIRFIGIGEKSGDLQEFRADDFVRALFEN